jgi:hypothetical protein
MSLVPRRCPSCRESDLRNADSYVQEVFLSRCAAQLEIIIDEAPMSVGQAYRRVRKVAEVLSTDPQHRLEAFDDMVKQFKQEDDR